LRRARAERRRAFAPATIQRLTQTSNTTDNVSAQGIAADGSYNSTTMLDVITFNGESRRTLEVRGNLRHEHQYTNLGGMSRYAVTG
jgi:hypothetical protein